MKPKQMSPVNILHPSNGNKTLSAFLEKAERNKSLVDA